MKDTVLIISSLSLSVSSFSKCLTDPFLKLLSNMQYGANYLESINIGVGGAPSVVVPRVVLRVAFGWELMSSGRKRRSSSLYKTHPLYGTIVRNSFSIDLSRQSSVGITLYRIVFKVFLHT